jgi:hypothetical protein
MLREKAFSPQPAVVEAPYEGAEADQLLQDVMLIGRAQVHRVQIPSENLVETAKLIVLKSASLVCIARRETPVRPLSIRVVSAYGH